MKWLCRKWSRLVRGPLFAAEKRRGSQTCEVGIKLRMIKFSINLFREDNLFKTDQFRCRKIRTSRS